MMKLPNNVIVLIKSAARKLTGYKRREFMAEVTLELLDGSASKAERVFGWGRRTVSLGMHELVTGIRCIDNYGARGNKKTEEKRPDLEQAIREIVEAHSQADPEMKSPIAYTKLTAKAVRQALVDKGYRDEELPAERTLVDILNRLGYRLRQVAKAKPVKKIPEVDEIFENVHQANQASDNNPESLRISVDTKAKVKIGEFSRGGKSRGKEAKKGLDHDMAPDEILVPCGILEVGMGLLFIFFGKQIETTDFIMDALEWWWEANKSRHIGIKELTINLDNGPHVESHRTELIKRMVEFSDHTGLRIHLVYYPPYHSKYNPIERCWGALENYWNGAILSSIQTALNWAKNMTWKKAYPIVYFVEKIYQKGISLTKKELKKYEERFDRSNKLPKWDIVIKPQNAEVIFC